MTHKILISRKNQLWLLIILSALTMAIPYYIQGALSSSKAPSELGPDIWQYDHLAWALRAIVEGLVIGYIAQTRAKNNKENAILWLLKIALILLIALTLGPVMYAALNNQTIQDALSTTTQWAWSFGLALYMPLMVLGASYAYKVQSYDDPMQKESSIDFAELETMQNNLTAIRMELTKTQKEGIKAQETLIAMQTQLEQAQTWEALTVTQKAIWIAQNCNGDRPAASHLAEILGCATSTVSRAYKEVD